MTGRRPSSRSGRSPGLPAAGPGLLRAGLLVLLSGLLLAGCSSSSGAGASGVTGNGSSFVSSGSGVLTVVPVAQRKEQISLKATTLTGTPFDLASVRGKPVVLNVWGSWCAPCRKEAPELQAAATALAGKATFIGIDTRDDTAQALAFERRFAITYPSLVDPGTLLLSLNGAVPPASIPTTLVLDDQGRIAARFTGPVTKLTLLGIVSDVAKGANS